MKRNRFTANEINGFLRKAFAKYHREWMKWVKSGDKKDILAEEIVNTLSKMKDDV
jgi:hypothetical protein